MNSIKSQVLFFLTVLKIITNFGPNFSNAANKCNVRTNQNIKSIPMNILKHNIPY